MKISTYAQSEKDLSILIKNNLSEVVLCHRDLSRFGKLETKEFNHLLLKAKELKLKTILEFDVIKTENEFSALLESFNELEKEFIDEIRAQDVGVLNWLLENTSYRIQLNLEGSNHNLKGIQTWEKICGDRLSRLILSIELNKETLREYIKELKTPVEILGLGRILLFYTPRNLLSALKPEDDEKRIKAIRSDDFLEATGESEESPHKGFPLIENSHGTFMFHIKRLNLLKHFNELKKIGLSYLRFDFRFDDKDVMNHILQNVASDYPYDSIKGFFNINKSDVLFKKLKNYRIQRKDDSYIGEVLQIASKSYLAIQVKKESIKKGDKICFFTPDGKEKDFEVKSLRDSDLNDVEVLKEGSIGILTYLAGVGVKSQIYKK